MTLLLAMQGVPEAPNLITLLRHFYAKSELVSFLHHWENLVFSVFIAALISLLFYVGSRKKQLIPTGLQNGLEFIVESFRGFILGILGPEGEKFVPFLGTLFLYILGMNLMGLIPLMKSPSANINITIALAICVFVLVQFLNIKNMGVRGFLFHLVGSPTDTIGWLMAPLMFPIELLTQISRPVTLALRLCGNILGEKILVGFFAIVSISIFLLPVQTPFLFLGVLTGMMQAMVFTLLSTIYILLSLQHAQENLKH